MDGSQETRTTSRKYGQKYLFAQMDTALQKLSKSTDCLDKLVFAVLMKTGTSTHGILSEFLEIVPNGLMLATR